MNLLRAITLADVEAAATRIAGKVLRSPTIYSDALSRATGAEVWLKLDTLQATGTFKERGAANRLALLSKEERALGVIAMSAGNHAQAVARHASLLKIRATIVMPIFTPAMKVGRTKGWGAHVVLHGTTLAEAAAHAYLLAKDNGFIFIHPYNDDAVIAGQGTLALELLDDAPGLEVLAVPAGGGGLVAGSAIVVAGRQLKTDIYGVEVETYSAMAQNLAGQPESVGGATVAEGIAVRDVGEKALAIVRDHVKEILVVPEHIVENAIALLMEGAKLVAEGAGAAGLAAVLAYPEKFQGKRVGIPITGANIDSRVLANVLQRVMLRDGRIVRLVLDIPDRPGVLAEISARIGDSGGNIIEVSHHRLFSSPCVHAARLEIMFEARDPAHGLAILTTLEQHYTVTRL